MESFGNFIGGQWRAASGGEAFASANPARPDEVIGHFAQSSVSDAEAAVAAAASALPGWRALSAPARGEILRKAADRLETRLEEVARAMVRENGKTITEARGETMRGVVLLRYYAAEGLRSTGDVVPSVNPKVLIYTNREPLGVVSLITPWNFPIAIPIWKMAPALVYGNAVVLKPASLTPHCAVLVTKIMEEAGLPAGVLNLVTGRGGALGEALVTHPAARGVSFTGSNVIGRQIAAWAAEHGKKYQLEMGGKNPVIVLPDCDLEQATTVTLRGAFGYAGQKCTATSRAIVHDEIYDQFAERLVEKTRQLRIGPGEEESTFVPPVASKDQQSGILAAIDQGRRSAKLLCGGGRPDGKSYAEGYYIEPTIFGEVAADSDLAQEEIFGPVLSLMRARDLDQAIELANAVRYGLSASLFTRDLNAIQEYVSRIEAGIVKVNGETAGVEPQVPFGGMKESSSFSREQGRAALEFFTSLKTIYVERAGA